MFCCYFFSFFVSDIEIGINFVLLSIDMVFIYYVEVCVILNNYAKKLMHLRKCCLLCDVCMCEMTAKVIMTLELGIEKLWQGSS